MATASMEIQHMATLADYLREAPLPTPRAVRYALQLADALRQAHDQGIVSGSIDPDQVVFSTGAMEFGEGRGEGAYLAPEVVNGQPADARSDVFAFGCVLYRLLTGRDAFPGADAAARRDAVLTLEPQPIGTVLNQSGLPGLDSLVRHCLAKDPEARLQRMQKVYLELKLLRLSVRKPDVSAATQLERAESALRQEIGRVERSLAARVDACDRSINEVRGAQETLREALAASERGIDAMRETAARIETGLEETARTTGRVEEALSGQLAALEEQVHAHSDSMESLRTAMSQTDDLLERVVEAFDSLQASVLEQSDEKASEPRA